MLSWISKESSFRRKERLLSVYEMALKPGHPSPCSQQARGEILSMVLVAGLSLYGEGCATVAFQTTVPPARLSGLWGGTADGNGVKTKKTPHK